MSTLLAEQVCLMSGMAPTEINMRAAHSQMGTTPVPAPVGVRAATTSPTVDEINCLLTGMPPTPQNISFCSNASISTPPAVSPQLPHQNPPATSIPELKAQVSNPQLNLARLTISPRRAKMLLGPM